MNVRSVVIAVAVLCLLTIPTLAQEEPAGADLRVTKAGPELAAAGANVSYDVTVTNDGPEDGISVDLSDPIPPGMTFVSATQDSGPLFVCSTPAVGDPGTVTCSIATLAVGASAEFTFVFQIAPDTAPGTSFANIATATLAEGLDPNEENNSGVAVTTTPYPPSGDLTVSKTGPGVSGSDTNVTYTITLVNVGPDAAENVTLTDTLPGLVEFVSATQDSGPALACTPPPVGSSGTLTCTAASFPAGATAVFTLTVHIPASVQSGTELQNTVIVQSSNDPNDENNSGTIVTVVSTVDVSVDKSGPAAVTAGDNVTYTITVSNSGPDPAISVVFTDVLPAGSTFVSFVQNNGPATSCIQDTGTVQCSFAGLGNGESGQFTLVVRAGDTTSLVNDITVATGSFDTDSTNDSDSVSTTVTPSADLIAGKSGPPSVMVENNVTYAVTVTNNGPSTAFNVSVTDDAPAGTTFVSATQTSGPAFSCVATVCTRATLAPLTSATFDFTYAVPLGASGSVTNTATVASTTADPVPGNNTATAITPIVPASADLAVTKTGPATVLAETNITFTVTLTNNGPSTASSVSVTDDAPAGTTFVSVTQTSGPAFSCVATVCTRATLAPLASATFDFTYAVPLAASGSVTNTATVASTTADPVPGNNTATAITPIVPASADLAVTKTGPATVVAGTNISFTVSLANNGPSTATSVVLADVVPVNATLVSVTQDSGPAFDCAVATCTRTSLAALAAATFTFTFAVPVDTAGSVVNTVNVSSITPDPDPQNNTSTVTAAITPAPADVSVSKNADQTEVYVGRTVVYTIVALNNGPGTATDVVVTDDLPAGAALQSAPGCTGTTTLTCNVGTLAAGASATFTVTVTMPATAGVATNVASVSSSSTDGNSANDRGTAGVTVSVVPAPIPTLSPLAMALLALALCGLVFLRTT